MKKFFFAAFLAILMVPSVFAVPALQIYIDGGTYNTTTDTWEIEAQDFEVWVIAANTDTDPLYGVRLVAAVYDETPVDGALTIGGTTFNASDFTFGTPPPTDSGVYPGHGVYPANYTELLIGDVLTGPMTIDDMEPGETGQAPGMIFKYQVHTDYQRTHFDAYGFYDPLHFKFAPPSHDGEAGPPQIPEPATMLLFGFGLAGLGAMRNRKK